MSTGTRSSLADRYFDAVIERQATLFDAVRNGNERYHRFTRSLIEGVRQNSHDWVEVRRRWISKPMDLVGLYESVSEAAGNTQSRGLALAREWLDDALESQREGQEVLRQGLGDVREAVQRVQESAPQFLRRNASRNASRADNGQKEPVAEQQAE
ncbi:MAG: hypothetical protein ACE5FA_02540 [Dehalococcoidia bacterium]